MKQTIAEKTAQLSAPRQKRRFPFWLLCLPLGLLYYFLTYVVPGYSFLALVCLCLICVILFYALMPGLARIFPGLAHLLTGIVTTALILGIVVAGVTEAIIIRASFGTPEEPISYLVVLGAKVRLNGPSASLQDRIDAAYRYLSDHPEVIAVVSGGQGSDEHMSEAQCMENELIAMGIAPERIWPEDQASSTWENIHFSLDLIEAKTGQRPTKIGVLSSEYHLFRASLFARKNGVEFVGIPARTSRPSQMLNHFLREIAGVWHYILLGGTYE